MASKYSLPQTPAAPKPTLEALRQRLGGREHSAPGAGEIVEIVGPGEEQRPGVVLFATESLLDVWLGGGNVQRVDRQQVRPMQDEPSLEMIVIASDIQLFAHMEEGQRVRCGTREGRLDEGKLMEKCRYGALVVRDDGVVVGAGFQRIWPAVNALECN